MKKHWDDKALVWVCEQIDKQFHLKGRLYLM